MKFKKYLNELFDSSVDIKIKNFGQNLYEFVFDIDEHKFIVTCVSLNREIEGEEFFEIAFGDENFGVGITNKFGANASKVFSGVIQSVNMFLQFRKPKYFYFTAKEKSRKKLYADFAKIIQKKTKYKMVNNIPYDLKQWTDPKNKIYLFSSK